MATFFITSLDIRPAILASIESFLSILKMSHKSLRRLILVSDAFTSDTHLSINAATEYCLAVSADCIYTSLNFVGSLAIREIKLPNVDPPTCCKLLGIIPTATALAIDISSVLENTSDCTKWCEEPLLRPSTSIM